MSPGPTFDRVYRALKDRLMAGGFAPGEHLEPAVLGEELHASVTPIRDALHRLAGERLVEAPYHDGFCAPAPSEADVRDMFGWSATLVDLVLRRAGSGSSPVGPQSERWSADGPCNASDLFLALTQGPGEGEHAAALAGIADRLAAMRSVESVVFDDTAEELAELQLLRAGLDSAAFRRAAAAYHRRRQRAAPDLLAALRRRTQRNRRP